MKKLLIFISLIISSIVHAQCYNGNITLATQQDVDNFVINYPGVDCINGSLYIGSATGQSNINDLSTLDNITSIYQLRIINTSLTQINNFNLLSSVNQIYIEDNSLLQTISGFNTLTNLNDIFIRNNSLFSSITGFQNIVTIGNINIKAGSLASLNLPSLQTLTSLALENCGTINNFNSLTNLTSIKKLQLYNMSSQFDFSTLNNSSNLTVLIIEGCNSITTLTGLHFAPTPMVIRLQYCSSLSNINAINAVTALGELTLSNLPALQNLSALSSLTTANNVIYLISLNAITNLSGLENLTSSNMLTILGNNNLNSISALSHLTSTQSCLNINANQYLSSLSGLENLTSIGYLYITNNHGLMNLNALNHPINITNNLTITNNQNLSNCSVQAICNYLNAPAGVVTIANNNSVIGCNSDTEVSADCLVPRTKIRTQDCGLQTTAFNQVFYADAVAGAITYEFQFTEVGTGAVFTHTRSAASESLYLANVIGINKTYNVRVRAQVNGVWGNYGAICQIKSPINPITQIRTQDCGLQTTIFNQVFYANYMYGASVYQFEFTNTTTGAVTTHTRSNNAESFYAAGIIEMNQTYNVRVRCLFGGQWSNFGATCQISSPANPVTQIRTVDCGLQTTTFNQVFYADYMYGASVYQFEFTNTTTGAVTTHTRSNNAESFYAAGIIEMNQTYNVRVRCLFGGQWSNFGATCQISSPANPVTQIRTVDCGLQTTTFNQVFYADYMYGASIYQFEFTNTTTGAVTTHTRSNNAESFYAAGIIEMNQTYNVRVRCLFGGQWSSFGSTCQIYSPANPVTQIRTVDCGLQTTTFNQVFYADYMYGASIYQFEFTNTTTGAVTTHTRSANSESFYAAGINEANQIYNVRVRCLFNGQWSSFGPTCQISSPVSVQRLAKHETEEFINESIKITMFPNPTSDIVNISDLKEKSTINLYNMNGQFIFSKEVQEAIEKIDLSSFDNGVYMIFIQDEKGGFISKQKVVLTK